MKKNIIKKIITKILTILILLSMMLITSCDEKEDVEPTKQLFIEEDKKETLETKNEETKVDIKEFSQTEESVKQIIKNENLVKVMPDYTKVLYSEAYIRKYNHDLLRDAYGELADIINEQIMSAEDNSICIFNFKILEKYIVAYENNLIDENQYKNLPTVDYIDFVKQNVDKNNNINMSLSIDVNSIKTYDLYHEFTGQFYKPVLISKKTIEDLQYNSNNDEDDEDPQIIIDYPIYEDYSDLKNYDNIKQIKKTKMYYDGDRGFLYYLGNETQANMRETNIKEYNDEYYAFYEDDNILVEYPLLNTTVKILRDANIGQGQSFQDISLKNDEYNLGDSDLKTVYSLDELFNMVLNEEENIIRFKTKFIGNYVIFDEKGYITDLYYIGEE